MILIFVFLWLAMRPFHFPITHKCVEFEIIVKAYLINSPMMCVSMIIVFYFLLDMDYSDDDKKFKREY